MKKITSALSILFALVSFVAFSQKNINQSITTKNGLMKIHIEKEENGKKQVFERSYNIEGMSDGEKQALIDKVTDSLSSNLDKDVKMRIRINRDEDHFDSKGSKGPKGPKGDKYDDAHIDIDIDNDENISFDLNGADFDMKNFEKNVDKFGKTLKFEFEKLGPKMERFGEDMKPFFEKLENGNFQFDMGNSNSKTIRNLTVYPNKPSNSKLNVQFNSPKKGDVKITVTDINGKVVGNDTIKDFEGEYMGQVDLKSNTKGTIFVTVTQDEDGAVKRIVLN